MRFLKSLALAAVFGAVGGIASAATIVTEQYNDGPPPPNDCAGLFGDNFEVCKDPVYDSPVIAKYDLDEDKWTFNTSIDGWGTVTEDMFTLNTGTAGDWAYDPGTCTDCPVITSYVIKSGAGVGFVHYYTDPQTAIFEGSWDLTDFASSGNGFSHITFYDTECTDDVDCDPGTGPQIPLPAGMPLMLTAIGIGAYMKRRARKSA